MSETLEIGGIVAAKDCDKYSNEYCWKQGTTYIGNYTKKNNVYVTFNKKNTIVGTRVPLNNTVQRVDCATVEEEEKRVLAEAARAKEEAEERMRVAAAEEERMRVAAAAEERLKRNSKKATLDIGGEINANKCENYQSSYCWIRNDVNKYLGRFEHLDEREYERHDGGKININTLEFEKGAINIGEIDVFVTRVDCASADAQIPRIELTFKIDRLTKELEKAQQELISLPTMGGGTRRRRKLRRSKTRRTRFYL